MNIRATISHSFSPISSLITSPTVKNFFIYSCGSFFLKVISLLIVPLNMRKFSTSDYGALSLVVSFISIASAIFGLGLRQVLSLEYFHCDEQQRKIMINDIIVIYCIFALPLMALAFSFRTIIITYLFLDCISPLIFIMALNIVFLSFFSELFYQIMQYEQRAKFLTSVQIGIALIIASLTLLFVWKYEWGIGAVVCAQLLGTCVACCVAYKSYQTQCYASVYTPPALIRSKIPAYLISGFPFIPAIIFSWALSGMNRWMLAYYGTMHDVGIYAIADLGCQVFYALVLQPWSGSYLPYIMKRYAENKNNLAPIEIENKKIMLINMTSLAGLIGIGSIVMHPILIRLFPSQYHEAIPFIWILLFGQVFLLGSYFASAIIQFKKRKIFLYSSAAIPVVVNITLGFMLIPRCHVTGSTISILISQLFYCIVTLAYNKMASREGE